ncbi:hypothetical protein ABZ733_33960, partial [Streptomyces longwoodensis]|uniref:hypothetical protein n=1 Tax=Streptomyces longwoodensis TaxID=68231 RepID=UPI0033C71EC5
MDREAPTTASAHEGRGDWGATAPAVTHRRAARLLQALAFRNAAALYLLVVMFAVFALWIPQ